MHSFRLRLILALNAGVTIVSLASTYFEVLEHKHILRQELEWRSTWIGNSLKPQMRQTLNKGNQTGLPPIAADAKNQTGALVIGGGGARGRRRAAAGAPGGGRARRQ